MSYKDITYNEAEDSMNSISLHLLYIMNLDGTGKELIYNDYADGYSINWIIK